MVDNEILEDFKKESKNLLKEMDEILEKIEDRFDLVLDLEVYGQTVDRMMGGAKSIAANFPEEFPSEHFIHQFGDYAALCKAVAYKASQIQANEQFYNVCIALLQDATDTLGKMLITLDKDTALPISKILSKTFLDRLKWVSNQFGTEIRGTVSSATSDRAKKMSQDEIDNLLKKLGINI
jgi:enamine deaminase RidA (YjgF/YER057c/UK114 family)